jgi:hypothetical protein
MEECALSHKEHGDDKGHDAIMMAIDNPIEAKKKWPSCVAAVDNAIAYAKQETGNGRHN